MELRQLEYFVAVAEEANFTRAAERVHISQSGVSAQIRQLESEVGAALIDRSGRRATVTPAGAAMLEHARAALAATAAAKRSVDDVNGLVRGQLVIGMVTACTIGPLFDALASFHRAHPGVRVSLEEGNSVDLIGRVESGALDVALVGVAEHPPTGLESLTIFDERIVAAVPPGHPLAGRRKCTLVEIADYPVVSLPIGTGVRTVFDRACAERGLSMHVALEASAPTAVADLAIRGLGVAVLNERIVSDFGDTLTTLTLDVHTASLLAFVWRTESSPALRKFLTMCRNSFDLVRHVP